jgi:hypothetical protein
MKRIKLTQGQVAIVDDADYDRVSQHKWYAHWYPTMGSFYAARNVRIEKGRCILHMHRQILGLGYGDKRHVDHIDGITLNNRRSNLRIVTARQNCQNKGMHREGRLVGAYFHKRKNTWMAQIRINGKIKFLGLFPAEQLAHEKYMEELTKLQETLV